ncbi:hypothetical protein Scel_85560 [Streptomyces cellostaticus]|nr:hypothetical protein Scel_85560 [Streptomyces cellostaticus]
MLVGAPAGVAAASALPFTLALPPGAVLDRLGDLRPAVGLPNHGLTNTSCSAATGFLDPASPLPMANQEKTRLKRMQYRPHLVEGLIAKTRLDLEPP